MSAGLLDIYIEQGSDFSLTLTFKNAGTPIDITGFSYAGKIRKTIADENVLATLTCTVLNQITNPGQMTMSLTNVQTSAIPLKPQKSATRTPEEFAYDLEVTYPGGKIERVLEGIARVSPEVTR